MGLLWVVGSSRRYTDRFDHFDDKYVVPRRRSVGREPDADLSERQSERLEKIDRRAGLGAGTARSGSVTQLQSRKLLQRTDR